MLTDPLVLNPSTTVPTFTPGTSCTFRKIRNGLATCIDGAHTSDQPAFVSVRQKPRKNQNWGLVSDFTVRYEQHFNAPSINGVAQPDIPLIVEVRVMSVPQYHSLSALQFAMNGATSMTQSSTFLARLQAGEGI